MSRHEDWIWFWGNDVDGAAKIVEQYVDSDSITPEPGVADEYQVAQHLDMRMMMRVIRKLRELEGRMDDLCLCGGDDDDCTCDHPFVVEVKADVEKWAEGMKKKPE